MPEPLLEVTAGWTATLGPFTLRKDGAPDPLLTGDTAVLLLRQPTSEVFVQALGNVTPLNQGTFPGEVTYDPDPSDLKPGRHFLRFKVTDATGKVRFYPHDEPEEIVVFAP